MDFNLNGFNEAVVFYNIVFSEVTYFSYYIRINS